jgi:hypothetical protein
MTVMSKPKKTSKIFLIWMNGWMNGWIVSHAFLSLQPIILSAKSLSTAAAAEKKTMKKSVMCSLHIIEGMLTYPTTMTDKQNKENYGSTQDFQSH